MSQPHEQSHSPTPKPSETGPSHKTSPTTSEVPPVALLSSPPPNGEQAPRTLASRPGSSRLPRPQKWSSRRKMLVGAVVLILVVGLPLLLLAWSGAVFGTPAFTGTTWVVRKETLKINVVSRGSLESASNGDIFCRVRSGTKGSTIATTIKDLVDPGIEVKEGERLIVLDSSG